MPKIVSKKEEILAYVEAIRQASQAYYSGQPVIADEKFDQLMVGLRKLDSRHPILHRVGHGFVPKGQEESPHLIDTVGSLPKVHKLEKAQADDVWTPKLDGISVVAYYEKGVLIKILTRGDGSKGINITNKIAAPNKVNSHILAVRGEAVLSLKTFNDQLSTEYANPRNGCAGIMNSFDSPYFNLVEFVAYAITYTSKALSMMDPEHAVSTLRALEAMGFQAPHHLIHKNQTIEQLNEWRAKCPYPTDGLVRNGIEALKFPTEEKDTEVLDVEWNYTPTGRLTPVIVVKELDLHGTKVNRAAAFHAKYVEENHIRAGTKVRITKANEIIPHIVDVTVDKSKKAALPTVCPRCKGSVDWEGVNLKCSTNCQSTKFRLKHFVSVHCEDIKGLGDSLLEKIFNDVDIHNLNELIEFSKDSDTSIQNSSLTAHEKKMATEMVKVLGATLNTGKLLYSMNLDGVGMSNSVALAPYMDDIVAGKPGWTDHIKQNKDLVTNQIQSNIGAISHVFQQLSFKFEDTSSFKPIVLTGKMNSPRKDIVKGLQKFGYTEGSMGPDAVLVCNDKNSSSSKMSAAKSLGIKIVTEAELWHELEQGTL